MAKDSKNDRDRFFNLAFEGTDPETLRQLATRGLDDTNPVTYAEQQRGWFLSTGTQCFLCKQTVEALLDADILSTYWGSHWTLIHKTCRPAYKEDINLMQDIDQSCNDCGWFKRLNGQEGHCTNPAGTFHGKVYAHAVMAHAVTSKCFQHRRHGIPEGVIKDTPLQNSLTGCLFVATIPDPSLSKKPENKNKKPPPEFKIH